MRLVEKHNLKSTEELSDLCFKSKNIYNAGLYAVRQYFFENKKVLNYNGVDKQFKEENNPDYYNLPTKVSQQTLRMVNQNFKSFFGALKSFRKNPSKFEGPPKIPKYLKKDGQYQIIYTNQAISKKYFDATGKIKLSQTSIEVETNVKDFNKICQVRILPKNGFYVAEVVYNVNEPDLIQNCNYASIDIGLNNLATVSFNDGKNPFILNGRPIKSINQFFNKEKSKIQSTLERRNGLKWSNKLTKLQNKRNNKVNDYLHKASREIVNQLVSKNISILIVGKNNGWKQDINIGKKNNQNFVQIPFARFIDMLEYKCRLEGITLIEQEESYTSKCSFLDKEDIRKHGSYRGKRIKRGLFKTASGRLINADLNGSYNIMKKAISEFFLKEMDEIEGVLVHPKLITV